MLNFNLSIKSRLGLLFCALGALCLVIAGIGMKGIADANDRALYAYERSTLPTQYMQNGYRLLCIQAIQLAELMSRKDAAGKKTRLDMIEKLQQGSEQQFELFRRSDKLDAVKPLTEQILQDKASYRRGFAEALQHAVDGDFDAAGEAFEHRVRPPGVAMAQGVERLLNKLSDEAVVAHQRDIDLFRRSVITMAGILLCGGALAGLGIWLQLRLIGRSLHGIQGTLQGVNSTLDLSRLAPVLRRDEIGSTAVAFNDLMTRIRTVIASVHLSMEAVSTAAGEFASGNADLASRTQEQTSSLAATASNMALLTVAVEQNAGHARQTHALAKCASDMAESGDERVQSMVLRISQISESSRQIAGITGVIESIAFQTNILALNAAVEASHAGEQGRGFAVVASEVRSLAQRAAAAAHDIKALIGTSVDLIQDGAQQVAEVGDTMGRLKLLIRQVSDIAGEIASASDKQNVSIEQVNQAIREMDQVTLQNSTLVEQSAAAAQLLDEHADHLRQELMVFKITPTNRSSMLLCAE